jgi:hypothetical protein
VPQLPLRIEADRERFQLMAKNPHPSGRPIRPVERKWRQTSFQYPAETYATPRLRPRPLLPVADAIGYLRVSPTNDDDGVTGRIGFVVFP